MASLTDKLTRLQKMGRGTLYLPLLDLWPSPRQDEQPFKRTLLWLGLIGFSFFIILDGLTFTVLTELPNLPLWLAHIAVVFDL